MNLILSCRLEAYLPDRASHSQSPVYKIGTERTQKMELGLFMYSSTDYYKYF